MKLPNVISRSKLIYQSLVSSIQQCILQNKIISINRTDGTLFSILVVCIYVDNQTLLVYKLAQLVVVLSCNTFMPKICINYHITSSKKVFFLYFIVCLFVLKRKKKNTMSMIYE